MPRTMTTKEQAQEMLERAEKASPAPWYLSGEQDPPKDLVVAEDSIYGYLVVDCGRDGDCEYPPDLERYANADFVAHARADLPELARSYIALQSRVEALEGALKPFAEAYQEQYLDDIEYQMRLNPEWDLTLDVQAKHWISAHAALHPEPAAEPTADPIP